MDSDAANPSIAPIPSAPDLPPLPEDPGATYNPSRTAGALAEFESNWREDSTRANSAAPPISASLSQWTIHKHDSDGSAIQPADSDRRPSSDTVDLPRGGVDSCLPTVEPGRGAMIASPFANETIERPKDAPDHPLGGPASAAPGATFELRRRVGKGGMGEVWEARQASLGRLVAVKTIRRDLYESSNRSVAARESLEREFSQEALISAQLEHPNIAPVHDLGRAGPGLPPMLAMKLVRGAPWDVQLREDFQSLDEQELLGKHLPILIDVAQAVAFAHSKGIVHRDLKPAQVMVGAFGETLLMDWGLAIVLGKSAEPESVDDFDPGASLPDLPTRETATNPAGTPALMAPEQTVDTASGIGPWTDIYLLGGTLYFILTGGLYPHPGKSAASVMRKAMIGDVRPPSERTPGRRVPPELDYLARRALAREPGDRPASAEEFIDELKAYLTGASRRSQSEEQSAEARTILDALLAAKRAGGLSAREAYARHRDVADRAARALELWSENEAARDLRARNTASRIESEIENGDLTLAEVHLEELRGLVAEGSVDGVDPEALARRFDEAVRRRRTQWKQRVGLAWAAGVLLLLHAVGMTYTVASQLRAGRKIAEEKDNAEANLRIARGQGEGAYDLVSFVLRDLKGALDEELSRAKGMTEGERNAAKHAIAGRVAEPIGDYFSKLDTEAWPKDLVEKHAERMGEVSRSLIDLGRIEEAEAFASRAIRLRERSDGGDSEGAADARLKRSHALRMLDRYDEARAELALAVAAFERADSARSRERLAGALNELGKLDVTQRDFASAERRFRESLALVAAMGSELAPDIAALRGDLFANLALVCLETDRVAEAIGRSRESVAAFEAIMERAIDPSPEGLANALDLLGRCHAAVGEDEEAIRVFERALREMESAVGPHHPFVAAQLSNLGAAKRRLGRLDEAEACFLRALDALRGAGLEESLEFAYLLLNYAGVSTLRGDAEKTLQLSRASADTFERVLGPDDPRVGIALAGVARALGELGRAEEAVALYHEALRTLMPNGRPESISAAGVAYETARLLHSLGEEGEAEERYRLAMSAYDQNDFDEDGQRNVRFWLGILLVSNNRAEEAIPLLERAVEISERMHGVRSRAAMHAMFRLAQARSFAGRPEEAREAVVSLARAGYAMTIPAPARGDFEALLAELRLDQFGNPLAPDAIDGAPSSPVDDAGPKLGSATAAGEAEGSKSAP